MCLTWIHKRCSGVRGDLSLVADGFTCKRCDGTIQGAGPGGDLVVDGETYGDGGADLAATTRIRNGWMKFGEHIPFLTSRAPPLEMKGLV